jgi:hypothetical protein
MEIEVVLLLASARHIADEELTGPGVSESVGDGAGPCGTPVAPVADAGWQFPDLVREHGAYQPVKAVIRIETSTPGSSTPSFAT